MSINAQEKNQTEKKTPHPSEADGATTIPIIDKNETLDDADAARASGDKETEKQKDSPKDPPEDPIVALEEQLASAKEEAQANYDRFLRIGAEFDNYKKRILRETSESRKYANETLLRELLSVVDNLERALNAAEKEDTDAAGLIDGVTLTLGELLKIFEKFSVKPIEAKGQPFDPTFHQAMGQEKTDKFPENTVTQEFQKGYTYHDRLLRPAMVMVAKPATDENS